MCWKPDLVRTNAPGRILLLGRFVSYAMHLGSEAAEIMSDCEKNTSAIDVVLLPMICHQFILKIAILFFCKKSVGSKVLVVRNVFTHVLAGPYE